jgi:hypothetical protein
LEFLFQVEFDTYKLNAFAGLVVSIGGMTWVVDIFLRRIGNRSVWWTAFVVSVLAFLALLVSAWD